MTEGARPLRLLDLFCGAGGAAKGYQRAGFYVVGVDIKPQPRYCGDEFVQADALEYAREHGHEFDALHASPPCQDYILSGTVAKSRHPRLVPATQDLLTAIGLPYVIENVPGAPLRPTFVLCGSMFGLAVRRHRLFECSHAFGLLPACDHSRPIAGVYGNAHGKRGAWPGMLPSDLETWSRAMGVDWMEPRELSQAIPPAYTEYIGKQLIQHLQAEAGR